MPGSSSAWATAPDIWLAIGRTLLAAGEKPLIPAQLARATGKDQSNVKREAETMVTEGLLSAVPPPPDPRRTGRPPTHAYLLASPELENLRTALAQRRAGMLRRGQEVVHVSAASEHLEDLFTVLSESSEAAQAEWAGFTSGDAQECMLVFDGSDPVSPAMALVARLSAAGIPCRRTTLTRLNPTHELLEQAHVAARETRRTRMARDTRRAS